MTTQIPEVLEWDALELPIGNEPLAPYIKMTGIDLLPPGCFDSACWRGYIARWEIVAGRLYLVEIEGIEPSHPLSLSSLFPGYSRRVFAHWYNGTISFPPFGDDHRPSAAGPLPFTLWCQSGLVIEGPRAGITGHLFERNADSYDEYAPELGDLVEQISIPEVEAEEMYHDPLGAVPPFPFGHMHWKWEEFKSSLAPGTTIWHFSRPWGGTHVHEGYASKARGRVDRFILTSMREIGEGY